MYIKTKCIECGAPVYINVRASIRMVDTRAVISDLEVSDIIHEFDLMIRILGCVSSHTDLDELQDTLINGFGISPRCVPSMVLNLKKHLPSTHQLNT